MAVIGILQFLLKIVFSVGLVFVILKVKPNKEQIKFTQFASYGLLFILTVGIYAYLRFYKEVMFNHNELITILICILFFGISGLLIFKERFINNKNLEFIAIMMSTIFYVLFNMYVMSYIYSMCQTLFMYTGRPLYIYILLEPFYSILPIIYLICTIARYKIEE